VKEPAEERVLEAQALATNAEKLKREGFDTSAISLADALRAQPPLRPTLEGHATFLDNVWSGYGHDSVLAKVAKFPDQFKQFTMDNGLLYCLNISGERVLCIPQHIRPKGRQMLNEVILDQAHATLRHYGELRTSEYVRRWFWW
ncbi:hypothetical protein C8J57DRAFT_949164, partial [Mycena rebaudengoi]